MLTVSTNSVFVGTSVFYAGYVEYGSMGRRPQPYLRPAIEMTAKLVGRKISVRLIKSWEAS